MPDTKVAGCAGQVFGCLFALIGGALTFGTIGMLMTGDLTGPKREEHIIVAIFLGLPLLIIGIIAYRRGVKPGREAAAIRAAQAAAVSQPMKRCPYCAEMILAAAMKCKHCGSDLGATAT